MENKIMITAVIVTYNRKELLGQNIEMLLKQTIPFDSIIIVDNCSTDGTYEYLSKRGWTEDRHFSYIRTEANIGGAGGFFTGVKTAYEDGADWIILMDDDGRAANEHTFEELLSVAEKVYQDGTEKIFLNSLVQQGELLSFKLDNIYKVSEAIETSRDGLIIDAANPFNGTLISRKLVEQINYPNKDFFIKGDEVDYKQRAREAGAFIATVVNSRYIHPRPETEERVVLGKKVPFFVESPWKEYYATRNFTYMYKQKGWIKAILFELVLVKLLAICCMPCKKIATIKMLLQGVIDGWKGKLGPTVRP